MRTTPNLPTWIREFTHPGYTNIYELLPQEPKLYCTETLLGDWDAAVLLLAKDAAPATEIRRRIGRGESDPWRHGERGRDPMGWKTNERVAELADALGVTCLYGSALAHMLKNEDATSGQLAGFRDGPLRDHIERVLHFVISKMPSLRSVVCLGNEAWDLATSQLAPQAHAKTALGVPVQAGDPGAGLTLFRLYHPSRAFTGGWAARRGARSGATSPAISSS